MFLISFNYSSAPLHYPHHHNFILLRRIPSSLLWGWRRREYLAELRRNEVGLATEEFRLISRNFIASRFIFVSNFAISVSTLCLHCVYMVSMCRLLHYKLARANWRWKWKWKWKRPLSNRTIRHNLLHNYTSILSTFELRNSLFVIPARFAKAPASPKLQRGEIQSGIQVL